MIPAVYIARQGTHCLQLKVEIDVVVRRHYIEQSKAKRENAPLVNGLLTQCLSSTTAIQAINRLTHCPPVLRLFYSVLN